MTKPKFRAFLKSLCSYYQQKAPLEESQDLWYERVHRYPDEYLRWAYEQITSKQEVFPKNLPNTMGALWSQWLVDHPEQREYRACSDSWCDGTGIIHAVRLGDDGTVQSTAFKCRSCRQSQMPAFEASSADLKRAGWEKDDLDWRLKRAFDLPKLQNPVRNEAIGNLTKAWGEKEWEQHSRLKERLTQ